MIQPNPFGRWREKSCQQYSNVLDVLQGIISGFTGTDLYNIFYIINEDLAVADLAGVQNLLDCIDDLLRRDLCHNRLDLDLLEELCALGLHSTIVGFVAL